MVSVGVPDVVGAPGRRSPDRYTPTQVGSRFPVYSTHWCGDVQSGKSPEDSGT